ncbi:MAG TPA: ATP-binding protein, partial [Pirellulaceae bacterium]|nr:ATP-binding protein [Pirellulaceae bacterium]
DLAISTVLTPQQRNYLSTAKESALSLLTLLNDVLDFSKIEAGRMDLESIPFSVREVVEDAASTLSVNAAKKRLELIWHVEPDLPGLVIGDPGRLRQVIVNLIGNAIKFTSEGEVYVRVEQDNSGAEPLVRFAVADTGIGIPPEKHATIFEAFKQSDSSTTRRYGGTGLGLAITAELVTLMGGKIQIDSQSGAGSTFHFALPLSEAEPTGESPADQELQEPLYYCRVLLWSACKHHREALESLVEQLGAEVELLPADPFRAAKRRNAAGSDVLLVIDAPAAAGLPFDPGALRARLGLAAEQVLILHMAGQSEVGGDCDPSGPVRFLTKPLRARDLAAILAATEADEPVSRALAAGRKLHLLVADDSPVNQEVARGLLELHGHSVVTVGTGHEALEAWEREAFDVVLMDLEMPDMDGLEAAERIRRVEASTGRYTPIIALTAHVLKGVRERCLAAGMDDCVTKPLLPDDLLPRIAALADLHSRSAAGRTAAVAAN